jgi:hypothetical protein
MSQGAIAVLLFAGFVFHAPWMIVVTTLLALADAAVGPAEGPVGTLFTRGLGPRLGTPRRTIGSRSTLRDHSIVLAGALLIGTVLVFLGIDWLAWVIALLVAIVAALAGGAGWFLGVEAAARRGRKG